MKFMIIALGLVAGASAFADDNALLRCESRDGSAVRASIGRDGSILLSVKEGEETLFAPVAQNKLGEGNVQLTGFNADRQEHAQANIRARDGRTVIQAFGTYYELTCTK